MEVSLLQSFQGALASAGALSRAQWFFFDFNRIQGVEYPGSGFLCEVIGILPAMNVSGSVEKFFNNQISQLQHFMRTNDAEQIESWITWGEEWGSTLQAAARVARTHLEIVDGLKGQASEEPQRQQQSAGRINLSRI